MSLIIRSRQCLDPFVVDIGTRFERLRLLRNGAYGGNLRILRINRIDRNRRVALEGLRIGLDLIAVSPVGKSTHLRLRHNLDPAGIVLLVELRLTHRIIDVRGHLQLQRSAFSRNRLVSYENCGSVAQLLHRDRIVVAAGRYRYPGRTHIGLLTGQYGQHQSRLVVVTPRDLAPGIVRRGEFPFIRGNIRPHGNEDHFLVFREVVGQILLGYFESTGCHRGRIVFRASGSQKNGTDRKTQYVFYKLFHLRYLSFFLVRLPAEGCFHLLCREATG